MMCQHLGLLYEANVDPTAILEAVAQAREACMKLKCKKCLDWVGFNRVQPPHEWPDQGSDHNHQLETMNAPRQTVHNHALLPALLVDLTIPEQALPPSTLYQVLQFDDITHPTLARLMTYADNHPTDVRHITPTLDKDNVYNSIS
jgi:hypothetical protein